MKTWIALTGMRDLDFHVIIGFFIKVNIKNPLF